MLLLKNGYIISGAGAYADILIADGRIEAIAPHLNAPRGVDVIDVSGLTIGPGLVDAHAHFRDPGFTAKEDIASGARSAAKGGYTSVVLMGNTSPPVDNAATLRYVLDEGQKTAINIYSCANVTRGMGGQEIVAMAELAAAGAVGFSDDGWPILDEGLLRTAMETAAALGRPLALHEEDPRFISDNGINAGRASSILGVSGSSREAEISMVRRDLALAVSCGAEVIIQHVSAEETVELIREAKRKYPAAAARIHAEATPHHFSLTEQALIDKGTLAKMNPPLRTEKDRLAIIGGLRDGTIDIIATDHAPHTDAEKAQPITTAPSGVIGLETALSLGIRELVAPGFLTMAQLFERMSSTPVRVFGLPTAELAVGAAADLVVFDAAASWTVGDFCSKSANSPFIGETLPGVVRYTICHGRLVYCQK